MHAGAEVGHEQEFADLLAVGLERHHEAGDAHAGARQALDYRRAVPLLAHALHGFAGARVGVLQPVHQNVRFIGRRALVLQALDMSPQEGLWIELPDDGDFATDDRHAGLAC